MTSGLPGHPAAAALDSALLPSRLLLSQTKSDVETAPATTGRRVLVLTEAEADAPAPYGAAAAFLRRTVGSPKPKQAYLASGEHADWACVVPKAPAKTLGGHGLGTSALAQLLGASVAAALLTLPEGAGGADDDGAKGDPQKVWVTLSPAARARIAGQEEAFLVGLLHRGVTLKTSVKDGKRPRVIEVVVRADQFPDAVVEAAKGLNGAMVVTRSFVNMPANVLNPETYETFVRELVRRECAAASAPNHIGFDVYHDAKLLAEGCGLLTAVGKGSDLAPRLLKLTYMPQPASRATKHVAIVGKGITFDSGGLDIKGSNFMRNMKKDMGGSAAALGAFLALARRGVPVRLTCWLAIAENMVSGSAFRPGDVYKARNGLSVEIDNTDAEGRLVLADALCLASEESPDWIIDLATLTGAARTALGGTVDALFSNDRALEDLLFRTGLEQGDPVWPLPLVDDYEASLDSGVADMVNSASSPHGGAITAALFLRRFVGGRPWTHLDTYMWTDKAGELFAEPGATAKCVRLVDAAVRAFAAQ